MSARALDLVRTWPVPTVAAAVVRLDGPPGVPLVLDSEGPTDHVFRLASISKPMSAWATLIAVEEGIVSLDDRVDAPGSERADDEPTRTLAHLLAHAGGYGFDSDGPISAPERTRIYSNTGYDTIGDHVAAAAHMPFAEYLAAAVFEPLGMSSSRLDDQGSPAKDVTSTVDDVVRFMIETVQPRLVSPVTAADATRTHWPDLGGIVPGVGRFDTCPWGQGVEIRGDKQPHWTGRANSEATFGHFGGAGTMMWIDPATEPVLGVVALTDRSFDEWAADALRLWPEFSDAALREFAGVS